MIYLFDGSYVGFLCCVFESFERKEFDVTPLTTNRYQGNFFHEKRDIISDSHKAKRVLDGLRKRLVKRTEDFFKAFLSEDQEAWRSSLFLIQQIFRIGETILSNYGNQDVLYFSQTLKKISRERHRMKAFTRFQKTSNGLYYAVIEPDFNVLPLISDFFRKRYADQPWLIYDVKRTYGLLYDKGSVSEVKLSEVGEDALDTLSHPIKPYVYQTPPSFLA